MKDPPVKLKLSFLMKSAVLFGNLGNYSAQAKCAYKIHELFTIEKNTTAVEVWLKVAEQAVSKKIDA